jgi:ketosteroid isomerase-like protein
VSQADVDRVRDAFAALDRDGIEALLPSFAEDFEGVVPPELSVEPDTYRGHDGVRRYFANFTDAVEDLRFTPEEIIDVGDAVLIRMSITGRGVGSGVPVDWRVVNRAVLRDGLIVSLTAHATLEEARQV